MRVFFDTHQHGNNGQPGYGFATLYGYMICRFCVSRTTQPFEIRCYSDLLASRNPFNCEFDKGESPSAPPCFLSSSWIGGFKYGCV